MRILEPRLRKKGARRGYSRFAPASHTPVASTRPPPLRNELDVSYRAARALGMIDDGTSRVRVEVLERAGERSGEMTYRPSARRGKIRPTKASVRRAAAGSREVTFG
jgi:hypothetical protein